MIKSKLNFHPSKEEMDSLFLDLRTEFEETGRGMYCNRDIIYKRFYDDKVFTFIVDNITIGFITWRRDEKVVTLDFIWILPKYRCKGYGVLFQQSIDREFRKRGDVALFVVCATKEGLKLALKSNFSQISSNDENTNAYTFNHLHIECIKILKNNVFDLSSNDNCYIEIYKDLKKENLCYRIPLNYDFKNNPTYFITNGDWVANIYYNGEFKREDNLKYILKQINAKTFTGRVACLDHKIDLQDGVFNK